MFGAGFGNHIIPGNLGDLISDDLSILSIGGEEDLLRRNDGQDTLDRSLDHSQVAAC